MRFYLLITLLAFAALVKAQTTIKPIAITDAAFNDYFNHHKAPVIHVKLLNATPKQLAGLVITYSVITPFIQLQQQRVAYINKNHNFDLPMDYPFPYQEVWLSVGGYFSGTVYVNNGLTITVDLLHLQPKSGAFVSARVRYMGSDSALNKWMSKVSALKSKNWSNIEGAMDELKFDGKFFTKLDSIHKLQEKIDNAFLQKHPSQYAWVLENERMSLYYQYILQYCTVKKITPPMWNELKAHKAMLTSVFGMSFNKTLYEYFHYVKANLTLYQSNLPLEINNLDSVFNASYADVLKFYIHDTDTKINEQTQKQVINETTTPWCKKVLQSQYEEYVANKSYINDALSKAGRNKADTIFSGSETRLEFGANLIVVNKMKANQFLTKLNNVIKGKAMVLDFWATWCGSCIADMAYGRVLHDQAASLPLEFVYICTGNGSTEEKWRNKINELKLPGMHFYVDAELGAQLMKVFKKSAYPSYVCIDNSGTVKPDLIRSMDQTSIDDIKKLIVKK